VGNASIMPALALKLSVSALNGSLPDSIDTLTTILRRNIFTLPPL
jgi:hypothetical protein